MEKAQLIRRGVVHDLRERVKENVLSYQGASFGEKHIPADKIIKDTSVDVDYDALSHLNPENTRQADIENALLVWNSLRGMHPYLARDERFWVYLTHTHCRDYTWKRWFPSGTKGLGVDASKEERKALENSIREHFFARGSRGLVRGNAVSRLWWWAYIANRYEGASLEDTLEVFLTYTDVRDAIVGRPATARGVKGFSALMDVLTSRYRSDSKPPLLADRLRYRSWFKEINRHGGVQLLEALPPKKLKDLVERLAVQAEQG